MSVELQRSLQVTDPPGTIDGHILILFAIMVAAGILGGIANYYLSERSGEMSASSHPGHKGDWIRYAVFGTVAALTVPLFLNMISSNLLEATRSRASDLFVFAGFCLIYVVASRRLFENLAMRLIGQVDQVRREVQQLKAIRQEPPPPLVTTSESEPVIKEVPREVLTYNDVELLRAIAEESFVYGNLAGLAERTGLARDTISARLTVLKNLAVIETRINERNVLHWFISPKGKQMLGEILAGEERKSA